MKEDISRMGQLQVDSVLLHTKHKRENPSGIRNLTKVTSQPKNVKGRNCLIFVHPEQTETDAQNYSLG